jgi:hypothetical protein
MAWDYAAEIHNLTNFDADDTSTTATSGEVLSAHATQWLTDGARDVINVLSKNPRYVDLMSSVTTLNTSSSTLSLTNAMVGDVSLYDGTRLQGCRRISPNMRGRASDINDLMNYATTSDPVYWINAKILEVYPTPTNSNYADVTTLDYPSVAHSDSSIASFPDEAEHLVVLYACTKALQYQMSAIHSNTDITVALTAIIDEMNETAVITDKYRADGDDPALFGDETQYETGKGLTRVSNALDNAQNIIDDGANSPTGNASYDAGSFLADEDLELLQGSLSMAATEMQRAQIHIAEWDTVSKTLQAEIQSKLSTVQGYISEMKSRMERDNQTYKWYQGQYAMLKQDYQQGIGLLIGDIGGGKGGE